MWKESYRIGVDSIDKQHMELFTMVQDLLNAIASGADREKFRSMVAFLKGYVTRHFSDEEAYQEAIGYSGIHVHRKMHQTFTKTVLNYEKLLEESGYDIRVVKNMAGTLTSWLIYHVADADQKITPGDGQIQRRARQNFVGSFSSGAIWALEKMAGLRREDMEQHKTLDGAEPPEIFVEVPLSGSVGKSVVYGFSKTLAFALIQTMTTLRPSEADEFVCSALAELAEISSGNTAMELESRGIHCGISPSTVHMQRPQSVFGLEKRVIQTGIGVMEITLISPDGQTFRQNAHGS